MLKNILIKCAELVNRDDILFELKKVDSIEAITNIGIKNDVIRLISYYNFIISNLYEHYFIVENVEELSSDENCQIFYSSFKYKPTNINKVLSTNNKYNLFSIQSKHITTNTPLETYKIYYNYTPDDLSELLEETSIPHLLNNKVVCYGIISEFLASKDQFEKSEFWKNKFLYEIFKTKTKKERRLKSTF